MPTVNIHELKSRKDWDQYVNDHPKGTVFHTSAMFHVFDATPNHTPMHVAAKNRNGEIVAVLCAVKVDTIGGVFSSLASRSIMYAEPICDDSDDGIAGLKSLIAFHDERWGRKTLFTEVRPMFDAGEESVALEDCGYQSLPYCNYVNDLSDGPHVLAAAMKSTQRKIRTAKRRGLVIENVETADAMKRVYRVIQSSYGRSNVPFASAELFLAAFEHLSPARLNVRIGILNGKDVAATVGLIFKDRYFAWFNGTTRPKGVAATATLVWDEIETACKRGMRSYDFGGAGWPNENFGPFTFKSRFGGTLVDARRYRKVGSQVKLALAKGGYELFRRFLSKQDNQIEWGDLQTVERGER